MLYAIDSIIISMIRTLIDNARIDMQFMAETINVSIFDLMLKTEQLLNKRDIRL